MRMKGLTLCFGLLVALLVLASCGHNTTTSTSPGGTASPTFTSSTVTISTVTTTKGATPTVTAASSTTGSPTTNNGSVSLLQSASSYKTGDTITVTLINQSQQTIYFPDHLSNCTALQLQKQINGAWVMVNPCKEGIATVMLSLVSGKSLEIKLMPTSQWTSGLYRASLSYAMSETMASSPVVVSTDAFQVG